MKKILHKVESRGFADHGWLQARHTFSFANYYNPERMHFGVLRVLNDDIIAGGEGFPTHPHDNMEIITIPITGSLQHKDSMGNGSVIQHGEVQIMSAGKGIFHSEFNPNENEATNLLQIWVFPNKKGVEPRYQQLKFSDLQIPNEFYQIVSPKMDDAGGWIHQNAWFSFGEFSVSKALEYSIKSEDNGLYIFVIEGNAIVAGEKLEARDGLGISETSVVKFDVSAGTKLLLMDVPMQNRS
jgi:redox-sensitive bicupin YhaK (pirin superfamily)